MKILNSAVLAALIACPAFAGSLAPIEVEPQPIVVERESTSSMSPLLIVGLLVVIGAVVSQQNND